MHQIPSGKKVWEYDSVGPFGVEKIYEWKFGFKYMYVALLGQKLYFIQWEILTRKCCAFGSFGKEINVQQKFIVGLNFYLTFTEKE